MSKFLEFWGKYGTWFGWAFTALVVGLLIWGHLFARLVVPLTQPWEEDVTPSVGVCEDAPDFAEEELDRVVDALAERGHIPDHVEPERIPCTETKTVDDDGVERIIPYKEGWILITLRDQAFDEDHMGETHRWWKKDAEGVQRTYAATILLPSVILGPDDPTSELELPQDAEFLVLLHEYVHAWGYDHVYTRLVGPFFMEKTGHTMTRSIYKGGFNLEGVGTE